MKVIVLSALAEDTGCAVRASYLSESLEAAGYQVTFVKPFPKSLPFKLDALLSLPWYTLKILFSDADVVVGVKSYPNVIFLSLFKKIIKKKFVVDMDDLSYAYSSGAWRNLSRFFEELFLLRVDLYTYHTEALHHYLTARIGIPEEKTYFLDQGVNLNIFKNKLLDLDLKQKLSLNSKKVLAFVGHFDIACNFKEILSACRIVFKAYPDAILLAIGDGPQRNRFKALARRLGIAEKIIWTGLIPREKVADFLSLSDICLLYYSDRSVNRFRNSMKIREYLAMGKRVVCNNFGELKMFSVFSYQTENNLASFSQMIIKLLTGSGDGREKKGEEFVRRYGWEDIGKEFGEKITKLFDTADKRKILFFCGVPINDAAEIYRGGAVARYLLSRSYRVTFTSVSINYKKQEQMAVDGLNVTFIGQAHYKAQKPFSDREKLGVLEVFSENIKTCFRLLRLIREKNPDQIVIITATPVSLMAGILAKLMALRVLIDIDDLVVGQMQTSGYLPILASIYSITERICVRFFDKVIVCSRFLEKRYKGSIFIPNMVDKNWIWRKDAKNRFEKIKNIVFVGLTGFYQGQEKVLEAFRLFLKENKSVKLIFVGGGKNLSELKKKALYLGLGSQVYFSGQVSQRKVGEILADSQIGLLPLWNTPVHMARHPLKLLEYLASGIVVVGNNVGEAGLIIENGRNGFLCPAGDIKALADKIAEIIKKRTSLKKISLEAQRKAEDFSAGKIIPKWMNVIEV